MLVRVVTKRQALLTAAVANEYGTPTLPLLGQRPVEYSIPEPVQRSTSHHVVDAKCRFVGLGRVGSTSHDEATWQHWPTTTDDIQAVISTCVKGNKCSR